MSNTIEPILPPPPAEPKDVVVTPDPGPALPFDVQVTPDPAPKQPFDVIVTTDGPPALPFNVNVTPDPVPATPFNVSVTLDPPPRLPVDVTVTPDPPPANPINVNVALDPAPWAPVDVPITLDDPPADPFDVPIILDPPPAQPFDVAITPDFQITPDKLWSGHTSNGDISININQYAANLHVDQDPQIAPDRLWVGSNADGSDNSVNKLQYNPADFDLTDGGKPLMGGLPWDINHGGTGKPTLAQLVSFLEKADKRVAEYLKVADGGGINNRFAGIAPYAGALDPAILAGWFADYTKSVGLAKVALFQAEQSALWAMNKEVARVFDPFYFLTMSIPGAMGHMPAAVDTLGVTNITIANEKDQALRVIVNSGFAEDIPGTPTDQNIYGPKNGEDYYHGQAISVDSAVDTVLENSSHPLLKTVQEAGYTPIQRFDANAFFKKDQNTAAQLVRASVKNRALSGIENVNNSDLQKSAALNGIIRVGIPFNEGFDGLIITDSPNPSLIVDDDTTRIPLSFTDLRKDVARNGYRSIYFRPLNLSFGTALAPEYTDATTFGRVDPVVGYQKTSRTVRLSFEVHAFAPEDLRLMYNKLNWLESMVYPSFSPSGLMKSGPVIRMRIGDAVSSELGGLPGIIKNIDVDYADAMWELAKGFKVPKSFKVSLDFQVLHDGTAGLVDGVFGVFGPKDVGQNTNNPGNPQSSETGDPTPNSNFSLQPGKFSKFGEPRK